MTAEQYADLKAAEAVQKMKLETEERLSTERNKMKVEEGATSIHLMNHLLTMSSKAMDNAFVVTRAAQSPGAASPSPLALPNHNSGVDLIPNPGLPALLGPSGLGPQVDGGGGKGKGKGSGSGKGQGRPVERRRAPDGNAYTMSEFEEFFGGLVEWQAASPVWQM